MPKRVYVANTGDIQVLSSMPKRVYVAHTGDIQVFSSIPKAYTGDTQV
jgi:hypothetical protein